MASRTTMSKLYIRIADEIRKQIEQGAFMPGDKLPTLAKLAVDFACSRATVREALSALRGQGLVEFRHGDGTYVRTATIDMWMEPLDAAILLGRNQLLQLVETIAAVLAGIASAAARNSNQADLAPLRQALFQVECAAPSREEAVAAQLAFYFALSDCANNVVLDNALRVLQEGMRSTIRAFAREHRQGVDTCRYVFDAVSDGNQQRARDVVFAYGDLQREFFSTEYARSE